MKFRLIITRDCWDLWNYIKIKLAFFSVILILVILTMFRNSEEKTVRSVCADLVQIGQADTANLLLLNLIWLTVIIIPLMLLSTYVYEALFETGPFLLLRFRNRTQLWLSKIVIIGLLVTGYFIVIFLAIEVVGISFYHSTWVTTELFSRPIIYLFLGLTVGVVTILVLQSTLSLFINPIVVFFIVCTLCIMNIYWSSPYIPGNLADLSSYELFNGPYLLQKGYLIHCVWLVGLTLVGGMYYKKVDLLYRK